jgi:hypothetical protein
VERYRDPLAVCQDLLERDRRHRLLVSLGWETKRGQRKLSPFCF